MAVSSNGRSSSCDETTEFCVDLLCFVLISLVLSESGLPRVLRTIYSICVGFFRILLVVEFIFLPEMLCKKHYFVSLCCVLSEFLTPRVSKTIRCQRMN